MLISFIPRNSLTKKKNVNKHLVQQPAGYADLKGNLNSTLLQKGFPHRPGSSLPSTNLTWVL